jgi:hypothetical protein
MRHVLRHGVALQSFRAPLATIAAFLDATERCLGNRGKEVIDRKIADLDTFGQPIGTARRTGEGAGGETVGQGVRLLNGLIQGERRTCVVSSTRLEQR